MTDALGIYRVDLKGEAVAVFKKRIENFEKTRQMYQRRFCRPSAARGLGITPENAPAAASSCAYPRPPPAELVKRTKKYLEELDGLVHVQGGEPSGGAVRAGPSASLRRHRPCSSVTPTCTVTPRRAWRFSRHCRWQ